MAQATRNREALLAEVASQYFIEKKTQSQIASRLGYSRSAISRLLTEAENRGIVEIRVHAPINRSKEMETYLEDRFDINKALVLSVKTGYEMERLRDVGQLAADYIENYLHDHIVVGVGWGTSIYETVNAIPFHSYSDVEIVQVIGAIAGKSNPSIDGPELAASLARKLNGVHHYFHSPLIMKDIEVKKALINQPQIMEVINLAYKAEITLLGIGSIEPNPISSSLLRTGYINEQEIERLKRKGGVANFCGYILDENGKLLDDDINRQVMAVDLKKLRGSGSRIIAVAAGKEKTRAIEAVLKGKLIDTLISDSDAISQIFKESR